jgi:hypothetical protein
MPYKWLGWEWPRAAATRTRALTRPPSSFFISSSWVSLRVGSESCYGEPKRVRELSKELEDGEGGTTDAE